MGDIRTDVSTGLSGARATGATGMTQTDFERIKTDVDTSGGMSGADRKWLEAQPGGLTLEAALDSHLDYAGYVHTANGNLSPNRSGDELHADADRYASGLDQRPGLWRYGDNGLPNSLGPGDKVGKDENGNDVRTFQTGPNLTKVIGDSAVSDADATASRKTQDDFCAKMSARTGFDVSNPPSVGQAKAYFQKLADGGASPDQIRQEYGSYTKAFFKNPGGVDWKPQIDPKSPDFNDRINQQPIAKDGKRLIDCEGFAAMGENILGGLKKNGQPMFDVKLAESSSHITAGFFPHGGDPRNGFVVDNESANKIPNTVSARDWAATTDPDTRKRYLMRAYMSGQGEQLPTDYGDSFNNMRPPPDKVKVN
jgi:hypothetical protein